MEEDLFSASVIFFRGWYIWISFTWQMRCFPFSSPHIFDRHHRYHWEFFFLLYFQCFSFEQYINCPSEEGKMAQSLKCLCLLQCLNTVGIRMLLFTQAMVREDEAIKEKPEMVLLLMRTKTQVPQQVSGYPSCVPASCVQMYLLGWGRGMVAEEPVFLHGKGAGHCMSPSWGDQPVQTYLSSTLAAVHSFLQSPTFSCQLP